MKKIVTALLAIAMLGSCTNSNYTVTGKADAAPGDSVFLLSSDRNRTEFSATVVAPDSTFTLQGSITEPATVILANHGRKQISPTFFLEQGVIQITPVEQGLRITGTPFNDKYTALEAATDSIRMAFYALADDATNEQAQVLSDSHTQLIKQAVESNLDNILGAYVYATQEFDGEVAKAKARLEQFSPAIQAHSLLQRIRDDIAAIENTEIGKPFIDLTLPTVNGQQVTLSRLTGEGKWVLLDFWATWCGPCIGEIPHLREAYAAWHDKGFEIYGVSLDNDTERWKSYVAANDMPWVNTLGIDAEKQSPAAATYGIRSIPSNFLISPEGLIVEKNLRGEAPEGMTLMDALKKHMQ